MQSNHHTQVYVSALVEKSDSFFYFHTLKNNSGDAKRTHRLPWLPEQHRGAAGAQPGRARLGPVAAPAPREGSGAEPGLGA